MEDGMQLHRVKERFQVTKREAKKLWDKLFGIEYTVESMDYYRKQHGVKYTTKHKGDDTWECSCESFKYESGIKSVEMIDTGRKHEKTCKHIRYIMNEEKLEYRVI